MARRSADEWLLVVRGDRLLEELIAENLAAADVAQGDTWNSGSPSQLVNEARAQTFLARAQALAFLLAVRE